MKSTKEKILSILQNTSQVSAKALRKECSVSESLIHRHLRTLCKEGKISKTGSPPKVLYRIVDASPCQHFSSLVDENWLEIKPDGEFLYGQKGFEEWCNARNFNILQKTEEYEISIAQIQSLKNDGLIDATDKITVSFKKNYLEKVFYIDFYSLPIFGKTLLGKLILYAKQNSDIALMKKIASQIKLPLTHYIQENNFDLIALIPHSVIRKREFLSTTLSFLSPPPLKKIFKKVFKDHHVAQKTLKSKDERTLNAEKTLVLTQDVFPKKILLIDDACGSGATINIAAKKIKTLSPHSQVYGLTFVGSQKGFEVIAES